MAEDNVEHIKDIIKQKDENMKRPENDNPDGRKRKKNGELASPNWGGARPGAGQPMAPATRAKLSAAQAKSRFIERVNQHVDDLFDAQLDLAKGEKVLMVKIKERDNDGKVKKIYHEIVEDKETILKYMDNEHGLGMYEELNDEDHYYYMTTKPANNQAIEGMLNRAFGKAPEKIEIEGGFFKAPQLNIEIVNPEVVNIEKVEDGTEEKTIVDAEVVSEAEPSDRATE